MRKLFKKSIACCLALALCLTLFAGAISANALTTNPSYSTEAVSVAPGESTTIKFTVSDFSEIQGVMLKVYVPAVVASIDGVTANGFTLVEWDDEEGAGNYQIGSDATGKYVKFMELANFDGVDAVAAFTFDIAVTVAADAAIGAAAYPAPVIQATDGDALVSINGQFADFIVEVKEPDVPVEPDPDEVEEVELNIRHTVAFESCVEINYKVATSLLAGCTDIYAQFDYVTMENSVLTEKTMFVPAEVWGSDYVFTYDIAPVAEIGCDIDAVVYATKADGTKIKSQVDVYSVKTYAYNQLKKEPGKVNPELLTLLVDLLRYASALQTKYNVLTDALVDAELTDEWAALGTDKSIPVVAENQSSEDPIDNPLVKFNKSLIFGSTTFVRFYMTVDPSVEDITALDLNVSYVDSANTLKEYTINGLDFDRETSGKMRYYYDFGEIAPADMRAECTAYVTNAEGTQISSSIVYGIETFSSTRLEGNEYTNIILAMLRYSDSALAYFS